MSQTIARPYMTEINRMQYNTSLRTNTANYKSEVTSLPNSDIEVFKNRIVVFGITRDFTDSNIKEDDTNDDEYCLSLYQEYLEDPDPEKCDVVSLDDLAKELDIFSA